ncbi:PREDICTED: uncharacterized protein C7orf73-like [Miniopterus natalensis]|uniref:uncharacterized protein C7orf73-like n=1 Tax=Miniopterus natalensis TaxID=291302 RepID=UPI0007A71C8A|nr:PREDICTED: uncharacterized protein C7orf73-like [Miniopterus natalensis]
MIKWDLFKRSMAETKKHGTARFEGHRIAKAHRAATTLRAIFANIVLQFLLGFTFSNLVGMYLTQNYDTPNLAKKVEGIKKNVDAKKKPTSS